MINFRYHLISLMAVFLALATGIVVGVSLQPAVNEGLIQQAEQDRAQVQQLRDEAGRQQVLTAYREDYAERTEGALISNILIGDELAIIALPGAPNSVVDAVMAAVTEAGATTTVEVKLNRQTLNKDEEAAIDSAVGPFAGPLGLSKRTAAAAKLGISLSRAVLSNSESTQDVLAQGIQSALTEAGLADISIESQRQAQLAIVVGRPTDADAEPNPELRAAHVDLIAGLKTHSVGVVLAGPNSKGVEGTDVAAVRNDAAAAALVSTVDVADLRSGVTTVIFSAREQMLGRVGHYGALAGAEAAAPRVPVR